MQSAPLAHTPLLFSKRDYIPLILETLTSQFLDQVAHLGLRDRADASNASGVGQQADLIYSF